MIPESILRSLLGWLGLCLVGLWLFASPCFAAAPDAPVLPLAAASGRVDAWPAVTVLGDEDGRLTLREVLQQRERFRAPDGPHANLGPRRDTVWVRLLVQAKDLDHWMLSIDYPSLEQIEVYEPARSAEPLRLGRERPFSQRPWPSRIPAAMLELVPGQTHELILRVQTRSSMVLPIELSTPEAFHQAEATRQLVQGLMAGAALCLLVYSLAQWINLRDPAFGMYAVTLAGNALFFIAYFGLGEQHLWGESPWLASHMAPLAVLVALSGACPFIERALQVGQLHRGAGIALRAIGLAAVTAGIAFATGLLGYRATQTVATVLGPLPLLLAVPVAFVRMRGGDPVARYLLVGWAIYGGSTVLMAAMLRGWIGANVWTQHAFQLGLMFEMVIWMHVLGVRMDELRTAAQRAHVERDTLRSLAHTDALTGLPNRRGLDEALARALPTASAERLLAVYLLDLDGFKPVNDRYGHEVGDALLVAVARRLESLLRTSDTVARLGGDEFVVVAQGLGSDADAQALGRKLLDGFRTPFQAQSTFCSVGLTIGYALAPHDGRDALGLLKRADAAMYAGKQAGRNCLRRGTASVGLAGA